MGLGQGVRRLGSGGCVMGAGAGSGRGGVCSAGSGGLYIKHLGAMQKPYECDI